METVRELLGRVSQHDYFTKCRQALRDVSVHEPKEVDVAFRVLSLTPEQVQALSSEFEKQISQRPPDKELTHSDWLLMVSSILERCPSKFAVQGQNDEQSSNWQQLFDDSSQW